MTSVREIMTVGVECIEADASLADAASRMAELKIGALPICNADSRLCGILTERDIVVKSLARGADPFHVRAGQCAERPPFAVRADEPAEEAIRVMSEHRVRRLVVVEGSDVVGIIGEADLARALTGEQFAELMLSVLQEPSSRMQPLSSEHAPIGAEGLFAHLLGRMPRPGGLRNSRDATRPPPARSGKDTGTR